jgi:hypothetical protein
MTQTVEQFLVEQLEKFAPGRYTLAGVLQLFKARLRFACSHLKGGGRRTSISGPGKDYNLSIFTFPTGVTEIKCLYNCGLKIRSDETALTSAFNELYDFPSTNHPARAEEHFLVKGGSRVPIDPGPVPEYSDAYRQRIRESTDMFWKSIQQGVENGRIKPNDPILGAVLPHPDPIEAPDSIVERGIAEAYQRAKSNPPHHVLKAVVTAHDAVPALEPVKSKIRKRKTQSRKRGK